MRCFIPFSQYFRKASGIIIFFDGSQEDGIEQAERWASLVNDECDENATIILVANKIDLGQGKSHLETKRVLAQHEILSNTGREWNNASG